MKSADVGIRCAQVNKHLSFPNNGSEIRPVNFRARYYTQNLPRDDFVGQFVRRDGHR